MQNKMPLRLILHDNITKCEFTKKSLYTLYFCDKFYNLLIYSFFRHEDFSNLNSQLLTPQSVLCLWVGVCCIG